MKKDFTWSDFGIGCCSGPRFSGLIPHALYAMGQSAQTDNNIQAELSNSFKKFKGVQIRLRTESSIWKVR